MPYPVFARRFSDWGVPAEPVYNVAVSKLNHTNPGFTTKSYEEELCRKRRKFDGEGLTRREVMARTAWAGLGVAAGLLAAGGMEKLLAATAPRVDESSPRIFGVSVDGSSAD